MKISYEALSKKLETLLGGYSNHVFPEPVTFEEFQECLKVKIDRGEFDSNRWLNEYGTEDVIVDIPTDFIDKEYNQIIIAITLELDEKERIIEIARVGEYVV